MNPVEERITMKTAPSLSIDASLLPLNPPVTRVWAEHHSAYSGDRGVILNVSARTMPFIAKTLQSAAVPRKVLRAVIRSSSAKRPRKKAF